MRIARKHTGTGKTRLNIAAIGTARGEAARTVCSLKQLWPSMWIGLDWRMQCRVFAWIVSAQGMASGEALLWS